MCVHLCTYMYMHTYTHETNQHRSSPRYQRERRKSLVEHTETRVS